jgi:hypothetical protein
MHAPADSCLTQGLEMTRRILELVREGDWEAVAALGVERGRLLRQWGDRADPAEVQWQIGTLQAIQALDREIESLCLQGKAEVTGHLRQFQQGRKAGKAYKS